jgi:septal ring factor EnvC (AmiA/AmiB activator)
MKISIPVSLGELVDKITILEIKANKISDSKKLKNINNELEALLLVLVKINKDEKIFKDLYSELKKVNQELWEIEDKIRNLEKNKVFNEEFIEVARSVYIKNDKRFDLKNKINNLFDSEYKEEKSYEDYQ